MDPLQPGSASSFIRSLNTALSLRYPLNSAGDPFHHISSSSPALQLCSVVNCLPISSAFASSQMPIEALSNDAVNQTLTTMLQTPLALLRSILPILRAAHDPNNAPATVITCVPSPDRLVGVPFSGTAGVFKGIACNALVQALDVLRREVDASTVADRRSIRIVNVDVGFLQPVNVKRTHRGNSHSPDPPTTQLSPRDVERSLPSHLRNVYTVPFVAGLEGTAVSSQRRRLPDASALTHKLLKIVLSIKPSRVPDRSSVGRGGRSLCTHTLVQY